MLFNAIAAIENESDRSFIEDMYARYHSMMYKKALSLTHNPHDAEDAVEAAMLRLIDHIPLLRSCNRASLKSYLLSSAKNAALDRLRGKSRLYSFDDVQERLDAITDGGEIDAGLMQEAQVEYLAAALMRLPHRERELLRMKYYEELSNEDIAAVFGVNPGSIRTYLVRARRKLAAILKEAERDEN